MLQLPSTGSSILSAFFVKVHGQGVSRDTELRKLPTDVRKFISGVAGKMALGPGTVNAGRERKLDSEEIAAINRLMKEENNG